MDASPVGVKAMPGCAAATVVFRRGRESFITAVVKVTCSLSPGDVGRLTTTAPIAERETLEADGRVRTAGDLAPFLPAADVVLTGVVRGAVRGARARLGIFRGERILLDRTFALGPQTPHGVAVAEAGAMARAHPLRAGLLGAIDRRMLEGSMISVPPELDPRYFHVAPPEQRVGRIAPGDGLLLDGMVPGHPRFTSRLPELTTRVFLHGPSSPPEGVPFSMRGDTLVIDVERALATLTFRGFLPLTSAVLRHRITAEVVAGTLPAPARPASSPPPPQHRPPSRPEPAPEPRRPPSRPEPAQAPPRPFAAGSTMAIDESEVAELRARHALPFGGKRVALGALEPADSAGSSGSTLITAGALPRPAEAATPFVPGPRMAIPPKGERAKPASLGATLDIDVEAVRALRAQLTPFVGARPAGSAPQAGPSPPVPQGVTSPQPVAPPPAMLRGSPAPASLRVAAVPAAPRSMDQAAMPVAAIPRVPRGAAPPPPMPVITPPTAPGQRPGSLARAPGTLEERESFVGLGAAFLAALETIAPRAA